MPDPGHGKYPKVDEPLPFPSSGLCNTVPDEGSGHVLSLILVACSGQLFQSSLSLNNHGPQCTRSLTSHVRYHDVPAQGVPEVFYKPLDDAAVAGLAVERHWPEQDYN